MLKAIIAFFRNMRTETVDDILEVFHNIEERLRNHADKKHEEAAQAGIDAMDAKDAQTLAIAERDRANAAADAVNSLTSPSTVPVVSTSPSF